MTSKNALLRGAALVAVFAFAAAAADAKPVHHKKKAGYGEAAPAATYGGSTASEVSELRSEIQALRATVEAQAQSQAAMQAQVAQAQAQSAQAAADAESAQAQLDTVPAQILSTVGELPKPKPSWAEKTQISGRMYFDMSSIRQKNNGVAVAPSGTAFDFKRFYIGIDHQFNDIYSANLTMDAEYRTALAASGTTTVTINPTGGNTEFFVKKAYLQAKYFPWLTLRAGAADLPWIPFVEDLYGYRYVEQTLIDRTKFGTSSDWGVHALGSFDPIGDPKTGPVVSYALAVVDGGGYRKISGAGGGPRTDSLDVEGRVSAKWYDFTLGIGGYKGRLYNDAGPALNAQIAPVVFRDASRFNAILAYANGPYRAGVEYFSATNWTATTNKTSGDKADGYSAFGSWAFAPEWAVFGKYEYVKPSKTLAPTKKDGYFNIGLQYEPVKIVDLSLVYKRDKVENGTLSTGNGTIGNSIAVVGGPLNGTYDEVGIFGQFRW
jgi:hypothetical protein